jgi:hypothetical protein
MNHGASPKIPMKLLVYMFSALFFPGRAFAREELDMLGIFDLFILTSAATSKYCKPEDKSQTSFVANFRMSSI